MLVWLLAAPAFAEEWSLRAAVAQALVHNLEIRQERLDTDAAGAALTEAQAAAWGPSIAASAGATGYTVPGSPDAVDDGATWSLGLSQPLPTGATLWLGGSQDQSFARRLGPSASTYTFTGLSIDQPLLDGGWRAARYATDAARLDVRQATIAERAARERLVVDVSNAYWELVGARESTRLAIRSVEIAEAQLADTKERYDEGFAGSGDVLQLERALGVTRQSRVVAEAAEAAAERTLARKLGLALEEHPHLVLTDLPQPPATEPDPTAVLARAHEGNASWQLAELAVEAARRTLAESRNAALPDLTVSASVGWSAETTAAETLPALTTGADRSWGVGATFTAPLAWAGARASVQQGRYSVERAELDAEATWQDVVAQVEAALDDVRRDRARIDLAEATLAAAQAGLVADQDLYKEGRGSMRDVVRSLEALEEAQVAGLSAKIDLQSSLLNLARLQGTVLVGLGE
jgi:outer membrane protein